jgi:hypothetical protein
MFVSNGQLEAEPRMNRCRVLDVNDSAGWSPRDLDEAWTTNGRIATTRLPAPRTIGATVPANR